MVPIAKAALVTLLLGCGATGTFALANGGFGIGTATENSNEQGSDVTPASPEVANNAGGNTDEVIPGPEAGANMGQDQVRQEVAPDVGDVDTREGKADADETLERPQPQNQGNVPASEGGGGLQEAQTLVVAQGELGAFGPSVPGNPDTNEEASRSDGQQGSEITSGEDRGNADVQQSVDEAQRGQETNGKVVNERSDSSLQAGDAVLSDGQTPDQTVTSTLQQNQVTSRPEGNVEHVNTLDSGRSS